MQLPEDDDQLLDRLLFELGFDRLHRPKPKVLEIASNVRSRLGTVGRRGQLCESQFGERGLEKCDVATGLYEAVSIGGWL